MITIIEYSHVPHYILEFLLMIRICMTFIKYLIYLCFIHFLNSIEISIYFEYNSNNERSYNFSFLVDNCSLNNLLHHLIRYSNCHVIKFRKNKKQMQKNYKYLM